MDLLYHQHPYLVVHLRVKMGNPTLVGTLETQNECTLP